MKKRIGVILVLALILAMLVPAAAHADLACGSSGEEVLSLQTMLYDMGYLSEEADGKFGAKTEAAVKEYQKSAGLEETGTVTDELSEKIYQDWIEYWDWVQEQLRLDAELAGTEKHYAPFCYSWETEDGQTVFEYCERHALLWEATCGILMGGDAESAEYSYLEWQAEVISLYNEWIALVSEPVQAQLEASKAIVLQLLDAQRTAMFDSYDAVGSDIDPTDVYYGAESWMRAHCAWLCQMMSTLKAE
ncbi:MAG: peptidoglycan-binding protein [Clostridia bacterium]|nr:peptidoglycan-binding protein [Clostridia bacterium]